MFVILQNKKLKKNKIKGEEEFVEKLMKWQTTQIYVGGFSSVIKPGCKKIKPIWYNTYLLCFYK